jgi:O-antigen ligase/tetratricopeptide (TPR) repeat protein
MEAVVLALTALAPWAFAAVHPVSVFALFAGTAAVLVLWAALLLVERRVGGGPCPVVICLGGVVALGVWQLVPLSPDTLAAVSPATAELRAGLFPVAPESLPGEDPVLPAPTISLNPGATRSQVAKLLAVLALFAAVRYAIATPAAFRRLAVVCVANGALLSGLALAQRFSSSPDTVYWSFVSQGTVFGPFVCKNHFPFYVNVCFGLGVGLLLGSRPFRKTRRSWAEVLAELGRHPAALWLIAALGLMLAATVYSLSRGGMIALTGAAIAVVLLAALSGRRTGPLAVVAVVAGLGVGLVGWFGAESVVKRLGTLSAADPLEAGRKELWARTFPLARQFPVWGTGYGTFVRVEPLVRKPGDDNLLSWDAAHNDYLETLIEGGVCQLLLVLAAGGLVYRAGLRAFRRLSDRPEGGLVLGGLFGFTAVVLHAFGDFGMQMPAIVVLVTVLAAHLTAAGDDPRLGDDRRRSWVAVLLALACLVVAVVLPCDGWRAERAERLRLAAIKAAARLPAGDRDPVIRYLVAAVAHAPDDAALRLKLADARYDEYLARRARAGGAPTDLDSSYLRPAVREYLRARAACPLLATPHVRLAGARDHLRDADPATAYLDRACRVTPADGSVWYVAGVTRLAAGDADGAWPCWRSALVCSADHLPAVVGPAFEKLGAAGLVERVLPAKPELLTAAAKLPPLADRPADRRAVLGRAADLLGDAPAGADGLYLRAWLLREAGRAADAIPAYERALERAPDRVEWRYELAELLFEQGDATAAREHARRVLRDRPDHAGARDLCTTAARTGSNSQ